MCINNFISEAFTGTKNNPQSRKILAICIDIVWAKQMDLQ